MRRSATTPTPRPLTEEEKLTLATTRLRYRRREKRAQRDLKAALLLREAAVCARPDLVIIDVLEPADDFGKSRFAAHWYGYRVDLNADGHRAQLFHTDLDAHTSRWVDDDKTVQINRREP